MINTVGNGDSVLQPSYSQQDNLGCAEEAFLVNQTLDLNQFYYTERQSSNLVRVRKFPAWSRPHYDIESEDHDAIDSKTLIYNK